MGRRKNVNMRMPGNYSVLGRRRSGHVNCLLNNFGRVLWEKVAGEKCQE
jgi:hypothetical protein